MANSPMGSNEAPITDSGIGAGGATAAQVQQALDDSGLSVNGSGIKVGVLSDSFNDLGGAAAAERMAMDAGRGRVAMVSHHAAVSAGPAR